MVAYKGARRSALQALLLLGALAAASSGFIAVDLGSEFLKVSLIKPGRTPISIVVNEVSKRKSPAVVSFVNGERLTGEEAMSFAVRYPETTIHMARDLLGKSPEDPTIPVMLENHALQYKVVEHPQRKVAAVQIDEDQIVSPEELVASVLQYVKRISEEHAGGPTPDLVLTVPAWFGQAQRTAYVTAAELAGFNVMGMINSHTAAALQYGIERDFASKTENIILYDMGSGSTEVALIKYSSFTVKEAGKPKELSQLEVKEVDWDHTLGSNSLDVILTKHFVEQFCKKNNIPVEEVNGNTKAMAKMKKQVRRTKEILSANTAAPMNVEEFYNNIDFASTITREEFETLAADFFARAAAPLKRVLERSGLKIEDITGVELLGGGSRVPKVQSVLSEALGGRSLDRHLDSDEAVAMGAGLFAANLSTSFRLRRFGMTDVTMFGVQMETLELHLAPKEPLEDGTMPEDPPKLRALLPYMKKLPIKRVVHFNNLTKGPIKFTLAYNTSQDCHHGLPPGVTSPELAEFEITGIEKAIERYNSSGVVNLRFVADVGGVLRLDKAEASVDYIVMTEKIVVENTTTNSSDANVTIENVTEGVTSEEKEDTTEGAGDDEAAKEEEEEDNDAEEGQDGEDEAGEDEAGEEDKETGDKAEDKAEDKADDKAEEADVEESEVVKEGKNSTVTKIQVPKKKTAKVALKIEGAGWLFPHLGGESLKTAKSNLGDWTKAEQMKRQTAAAKNELEAYIIKMQTVVSSDESVEAVTTEEQRENFNTALSETEDWLYEDGEHEQAPEYRKRLSELKAIGDKMLFRSKEASERPQIVKAAREAMELNIKVVNMWGETKPWITEGETEDVTKKINDFVAWLDTKEKEQAEKEAHEEPAYTTDDVMKQYTKADKLYQKIGNKKKPKPPPEPKKEKTEDGEEKDAEKAGENDKEDKEEEKAKDSKEEDKKDGSKSKDSKNDDKKDDKKAKDNKKEDKKDDKKARDSKKDDKKGDKKAKDSKKDDKKDDKKAKDSKKDDKAKKEDKKAKKDKKTDKTEL